MELKEIITSGQAVLGIELGSTRIKAVLIGPDHTPIASGDHGWENRMRTACGPTTWTTCGRGFRTPMPACVPTWRRSTESN